MRRRARILHGPPELDQATIDLQIDLVEMPDVAQRRGLMRDYDPRSASRSSTSRKLRETAEGFGEVCKLFVRNGRVGPFGVKLAGLRMSSLENENGRLALISRTNFCSSG
jgi:hypothetical protein